MVYFWLRDLNGTILLIRSCAAAEDASGVAPFDQRQFFELPVHLIGMVANGKSIRSQTSSLVVVRLYILGQTVS